MPKKIKYWPCFLWSNLAQVPRYRNKKNTKWSHPLKIRQLTESRLFGHEINTFTCNKASKRTLASSNPSGLVAIAQICSEFIKRFRSLVGNPFDLGVKHFFLSWVTRPLPCIKTYQFISWRDSNRGASDSQTDVINPWIPTHCLLYLRYFY